MFSLSNTQAQELKKKIQTPCYIYDRASLEDAAKTALAFPAPYGFTLRYAMKANPNLAILQIFQRLGLHIDASSDHEVIRALRAGFTGTQIQLTSQMPSQRLADFVDSGVLFNACSLHQLEEFCKIAPGQSVSIRVNPSIGSGSTNRTNTGGTTSSFGIWHEYLERAKEIARKGNVTINRLHTHIGSGSDPYIWKQATRLTLDIAKELPDVHTVNLGGGFSVGRMPGERTTSLQEIGEHVRHEFEHFFEAEGRKFHLEIEPGMWLVARAGVILATCVDVVDTGREGYLYAKLDTGMTEITRPSLYGAQHPIEVLATNRPMVDTIFVGPCCESGDILTPAPRDPEGLAPRPVQKPEIGDLVIIGGAGAYCAGMATINYNSYPQAPEVLRETDGSFQLLRTRQKLEQIWANEIVRPE